MQTIRRALISVSDKTGIVDFAKQLAEKGVEILSTGGTYSLLTSKGIPAKQVQDETGFPEILDGRVKTLHPRIHGGLLAVRDFPSHRQQLEENEITPIDLVVVNLYPFQQTIEKEDVAYAEAIENIDIGGPSMLRSAAKNHRYVTVVVDPADYDVILAQIEELGGTADKLRQVLSAKAFSHTAAYDAIISQYMNQQAGIEYPAQHTVTFNLAQTLRYGENPHQKAAYYQSPTPAAGTLAAAKQLHGKELSYNNLQDADAALQLVSEFAEPAVVAIKHMNPCGVGIGNNIQEAYQKAYESDPVSIFGGIIATNRPIDLETAKKMSEIFLEIVIAPSFDKDALAVLTTKKNLRLLELGEVKSDKVVDWNLRTIGGGALLQQQDIHTVAVEDCQVVTDREPTKEELAQLAFAWKICKHVKSNAIVLTKDFRTVGVGAGQMNRVGSAQIAIRQAGADSKGSVMASDAFFPMKDTLEEAARAGVTAIIQPGGSIRDQESIDEANRQGIAMIFTGMRHFRH
ncbi:bifunctional phosphoribosylaminoimidazolecarboxamide formyltransferase/IMP cyclohydrolase [Risungbinella massiliensis]|uniref:bifunctional phosphoribosylaminoimidazolecarboxamide formyltransferase/IMP cyclohydrolase n=1 Tax=Risungbinella massiliensis TaxID=1329796 RepID=UPI0005CBAF29|nr:bifunctional phosphoribosylaminoimidazolecarboxamide formyltransferase/IMP cyclohydrolase [Risungbinella massiliensis]